MYLKFEYKGRSQWRARITDTDVRFEGPEYLNPWPRRGREPVTPDLYRRLGEALVRNGYATAYEVVA